MMAESRTLLSSNTNEMANALSVSPVSSGSRSFGSLAVLWIGFGALAGLITVGVLQLASRSLRSASVPAASVAPPPAPLSSAASVVLLPVIPSASPTASSSAASAEREWLDRVQAKMVAGKHAAALDMLSQHRARFVQPQFLPEAQALRIELLFKVGEKAEAKRLARLFLSKQPDGSAASRVRSLLHTFP